MNIALDRGASAYEGIRGERSLLQLRMIELVVFAVIVFGSKQIADFSLQTTTFTVLFIAAALLQVVGRYVPELWEAHTRQRAIAGSVTVWYSSIVDSLTAIGIVYLTGTIESPFLFLLVVPVFFACHSFTRRESVGAILLGVVGVVAIIGYLELRQIIPHFNCYPFGNVVYLNPHYYVGTLLVLGGFLSLVVFLANAFKESFHASIDTLRRKGRETHDKMEEVSRLYDISLGISAVMTVDTLLKMVAREVTVFLRQPWASVVLFNQQREITNCVMVGMPDEYKYGFGHRIREGGFTESLLDGKGAIVVKDAAQDKRSRAGEFPATSGVRSFIAVPLSTGQHVIGVFYVGDFVQKRFDNNHLRLLTMLCDQLSIAIMKSKLYESIHRKMEDYEKEIEELKKVNHLKSEYVSHVSHELRTPLTAIKAYMETLQNHIDDPAFDKKRDFVAIVSGETERLIRIVNDILDVSNIEFGRRPLQWTNFSLEELIAKVVSMLDPSLQEKQITVETIMPESLPKARADKDLITQVFVNLVNNAIKYSPPGTTIRIRAVERAIDVSVAIEDEGIGIPAAQVDKIFDKYFRVKSEHSRHFDGVGLGLAIVKNIIEQHNGVISVVSEENVGSTFTFTIPKEHVVNTLLGYVSERIEPKSELHQLLTIVVQMIAELLSAKIVSFMLLDETRSELFIKVSCGLDERIVGQTRVKVGEGIAGSVAESGLPLLIDNIEKNGVYESPNKPQYETTSLISVPVSLRSVVIGVINVNNKTSGEPFNQDDMNLIASFAERISIALERLETTGDAAGELQGTVDALRMLLQRQVRTGTVERTMELAIKTARKLRLNERTIKVIQYTASVHDIGMTRISDDILNKTFRLTPDEVGRIHKHPQMGTDLIKPLEFVELVSNIILHHHERVDGRGYPMGLRGDEIPIGSRILAIVDAYQSMTSDRPYREKMAPEDAIMELVECSGTHFDAEVVDAFVDVVAGEGRITVAQKKKFRKMLKEGVPGT
jgi:K+-sensing histidine kinase KdpD